MKTAWANCLLKDPGTTFVSVWTDAGYRCAEELPLIWRSCCDGLQVLQNLRLQAQRSHGCEDLVGCRFE